MPTGGYIKNGEGNKVEGFENEKKNKRKEGGGEWEADANRQPCLLTRV